MSKALLIEEAQLTSQGENKVQYGGTSSDNPSEKFWKSKRQNQKRKSDQIQNYGRRNEQDRHPRTAYPKYGKDHHGECRQGTNICFRCGKPGHIVRDCKVGQGFLNKNNHDGPKKAQARVYALTQKEADHSPSVVIGNP